MQILSFKNVPLFLFVHHDKQQTDWQLTGHVTCYSSTLQELLCTCKFTLNYCEEAIMICPGHYVFILLYIYYQLFMHYIILLTAYGGQTNASCY